MLIGAIADKQLPFKAVLMDTWYATKALMLLIELRQKIYIYPLKDTRLVDDSDGQVPSRRVDALSCCQEELHKGKFIKIKDLPKGATG